MVTTVVYVIVRTVQKGTLCPRTEHVIKMDGGLCRSWELVIIQFHHWRHKQKIKQDLPKPSLNCALFHSQVVCRQP